jgi:hypothetical protein
VGALEQVQAVREQLVSSGEVVAPDGERREILPVAIGPIEGGALRDRIIEEGRFERSKRGSASPSRRSSSVKACWRMGQVLVT